MPPRRRSTRCSVDSFWICQHNAKEGNGQTRVREIEQKRAYIVVREGAAVLELLAGKDEALLVGRDALLVLDLRLDIVNGIRRLDLWTGGRQDESSRKGGNGERGAERGGHWGNAGRGSAPRA